MSFAKSTAKRFLDFKNEVPSPTRYFETEKLTLRKIKRNELPNANPQINCVNFLPRGPKRKPVQDNDFLVNHLLLEQQESEEKIRMLKEELDEERHRLELERKERERLQRKVQELQRQEKKESKISFNFTGSEKDSTMGIVDVFHGRKF